MVHIDPCPVQDVVHLMTFIVVALDDSEGVFKISELAADPDHNGYPEYVDDSDIHTEIRLHSWPSGPDAPAFVINGTLVANEGKSWSDVKTMFR